MARSVGLLAHSLANLFRDHSQALEPYRHHGNPHDQPEFLLQAQGPSQGRPQSHAQAPAQSREAHATGATPTRREVLNYLGDLAKDYHLPPKLVYAVADAESSVDPKIPRQPNYLMRNGKRVLDEKGHPRVVSWDYGLFQINDKARIGKEIVRDPAGHRFTIGEDVKGDWKANARGAVAILAREYQVAEMEQGPATSAQDLAQQTYSGYTHSSAHRDMYLRERHDGLPANKKDHNFLEKYKQAPHRPE